MDYTRDDGVTLDPNAVLERLRKRADPDLALLDAWMSKGGVAPKAWIPYGTSPDTRWAG